MQTDMSACLDRPCICEQSLDVTHRCTPHERTSVTCLFGVWWRVCQGTRGGIMRKGWNKIERLKKTLPLLDERVIDDMCKRFWTIFPHWNNDETFANIFACRGVITSYSNAEMSTGVQLLIDPSRECSGHEEKLSSACAHTPGGIRARDERFCAE